MPCWPLDTRSDLRRNGYKASPQKRANYLAPQTSNRWPTWEIDIGTFRQSALFLLSGDLGGFHFDINGIFSEQAEGIIRRGQFGQTLSVSHPLGRFTVAGELWHFTQPLTQRNAVGNLWALSYPIRTNLVVDAGFNHGLTSSSTQWEGFAGFTYVLPHRTWRNHGE
jgi:hypothetical protein